MVFFLGDELIQNGPKIDGFYDFIQNIFIAYREGKHVVIISAKNAAVLVNDNHVDETSKVFLRHYIAHDRANFGLLNVFPIIINIVCTDDLTIFSNYHTHQEFRNVHFTNLIDTSTIQKTILLGENGNDCEVYALFCEYYRKFKKLSVCELSYKRQTGGGSTTVKEFKNIYEKAEEFCICILDSDRKTPKKGLGNTANDVVKFCISNNLLNPNHKCHHLVLNTLEVENLLPLEFYKKTFNTQEYEVSLKRYELLEAHEQEHICHADFKQGVGLFCNNGDNEICEFWYEVILNHKFNVLVDNDYSFYLKGFGNNILSSFLNYDKDLVYQSVSGNPRLHSNWLEIGGILSSFILGTQRKRVI